jgi:hypothetical protein
MLLYKGASYAVYSPQVAMRVSMIASNTEATNGSATAYWTDADIGNDVTLNVI